MATYQRLQGRMEGPRRRSMEYVPCGRLAKGLGWFSIGLGLTEILMPRRLSDWIGAPRHPWLMRLLGAREITSGIGILSRRRPAGWVWSRVAGDTMDLTLLGAAFASDESDPKRLAIATAAVAPIAALDIYTARQLGRGNVEATGRAQHTVESIFINRSPEECYSFWHDFQNLPRFMNNLESVRKLDERRSHWKVKGPAGKSVEWDAHIVEDYPNSMISWRTVDRAADVHNSGTVRFERAPGNRGTIVKVELNYVPPAGALGVAVAKLFGTEPGQQLYDGLRAFKSILETGEVVRSDSSIHRGMHAAQPPAEWTGEPQRQLSPVS